VKEKDLRYRKRVVGIIFSIAKEVKFNTINPPQSSFIALLKF
jgi:hypothetical protein